MTTLPSVCCTQASIYISPSCLRTRIGPSLRYSLKRDSSKKTQCLQWRRSQSRCRCAHCRLRRRCSLFSLGHLAGLRERYPAVKSRRLMVPTEIRRPIRRLNSTLNWELEWNWLYRRIRSSLAFVGIWRCLWGLWLGVLVSLDRFKILEMAPCDTPVMAAISNGVRPSRDNLTIICNIADAVWRAMSWSCVLLTDKCLKLWFFKKKSASYLTIYFRGPQRLKPHSINWAKESFHSALLWEKWGYIPLIRHIEKIRELEMAFEQIISFYRPVVYTYKESVWPWQCDGWHDTVIISCLVSNVYFSFIVEDSPYDNSSNDTDNDKLWWY